ncbi:probable bifunctional methylenetetrahydrofolate dehydrogenase cyclohydrolase 2 [Pelobates cultripes]|uniref:Probable bifunctional methylenetetrahydrofolate dehydrogenase cyclohydrolase 2 n=1 Tax=Pelobates cultripes TaxID=61616 RepID=A0AAD1SJF8_PELCU|nr:probable bifunctional methylenetetrahydrofolate dehydrogenase cyclohydrolase 2 [Pelobates cultripes]
MFNSVESSTSAASSPAPEASSSLYLSRSKATVISGTKLAKEIHKEVQKDVASWLTLGNKRPHLSVILVGDNPASHTYVKNKIKAATTVGISTEVIQRPRNISQEELLDVIVKLNNDSSVSGLLRPKKPPHNQGSSATVPISLTHCGAV